MRVRPGHVWCAACLAADVDRFESRKDLADVLHGHRPRRDVSDATAQALELLISYPGCALVLLPLVDGGWVAAARRVDSPLDPPGPVSASVRSAPYASGRFRYSPRRQAVESFSEPTDVLDADQRAQGEGAQVVVACGIRAVDVLCHLPEHFESAGLPVDRSRVLERP